MRYIQPAQQSKPTWRQIFRRGEINPEILWPNAIAILDRSFGTLLPSALRIRLRINGLRGCEGFTHSYRAEADASILNDVGP